LLLLSAYSTSYYRLSYQLMKPCTCNYSSQVLRQPLSSDDPNV
jgi:hypothetical protein